MIETLAYNKLPCHELSEEGLSESLYIKQKIFWKRGKRILHAQTLSCYSKEAMEDPMDHLNIVEEPIQERGTTPSVLPKKLFPEQVELNVGGKLYNTTVSTLTRLPNNLIEKMFTGQTPISKDGNGRFFIDRDGEIFAHVLNFLRTKSLTLQDNFNDMDALMQEAEFYEINDLKRLIQSHAATTRRLKIWKATSGHISLHVRANFAIKVGRNAQQADHPFRKIQRIFVCGKVSLCQEVFEADLNETRESLPSTSRYTSRFFLRHTQLEKAFDQLKERGFRLINGDGDGVSSTRPKKPGNAGEDWSHFNIFVFFR